MNFMTSAIEAQAHHETYIAILQGLLGHGEKKKLAQSAGITVNYLSNILDVDHQPPSKEVAEKITKSLSISSEVRDNLFEHMVLANEKKVRENRALYKELLDSNSFETIEKITKLRHLATFAPTPRESKYYYSITNNTARVALNRMDPWGEPIAYIKLLLIIQDVLCVLDRPGEALWYVKCARYFIESLSDGLYHRDREIFDDLYINIVFAEAISYQNLKHFRAAIDSHDEASSMVKEFKQRESFWMPAILRGKIITYSNVPRFSIRDLEKHELENRRICDNSEEATAQLNIFLTSEALARAYIQYGNIEKAQRLLQSEFECLEDIPHIGIIHKVKFLKTYAQLHRAQNDLDGWEYFIDVVYNLSIEAGLVRDIVQINNEITKYGYRA